MQRDDLFVSLCEQNNRTEVCQKLAPSKGLIVSASRSASGTARRLMARVSVPSGLLPSAKPCTPQVLQKRCLSLWVWKV